MTLIEYTYIRFFYLRRRTSGITPSERAKAVFFISLLDVIWLQSIIIIIDLVFKHIMFEHYHITFGIILIGGIISIMGRNRQLWNCKSFSKINSRYRNLNHRKWDTMSNIYVGCTFIIYILCCVMLYYSN